MTNQDMLKAMKGTREDKQAMFDLMLERVSHGETLTDAQVVVMEALKRELTRKSEVIQMSAAMSGMSRTKVS